LDDYPIRSGFCLNASSQLWPLDAVMGLPLAV
jgi:hypothetical protein